MSFFDNSTRSCSARKAPISSSRPCDDNNRRPRPCPCLQQHAYPVSLETLAPLAWQGAHFQRPVVDGDALAAVARPPGHAQSDGHGDGLDQGKQRSKYIPLPGPQPSRCQRQHHQNHDQPTQIATAERTIGLEPYRHAGQAGGSWSKHDHGDPACLEHQDDRPQRRGGQECRKPLDLSPTMPASARSARVRMRVGMAQHVQLPVPRHETCPPPSMSMIP